MPVDEFIKFSQPFVSLEEIDITTDILKSQWWGKVLS